MEKGVQRWVVDISKWDPAANDFSSALSLLRQHEHASITRLASFPLLSPSPSVFSRRKENNSSHYAELYGVVGNCYRFSVLKLVSFPANCHGMSYLNTLLIFD